MTTRQQLEDAPMFTVFSGAPLRMPLRPTCCEIESDITDDDVFDEARRRGINTGRDFQLQRDDEEVRANGIAANYDDIDAALDALACGRSLVKLPDFSGGERWSLYVVQP